MLSEDSTDDGESPPGDTTSKNSPPLPVTIAGSGYDAGRLPETHIFGTEHIVIDGDPLCNHKYVRENIQDGTYVTKPTEYPLGSGDVCNVCGTAFAREYGSQDEDFAALPEFEEGDWIRVTAKDGRVLTGRVRHEAQQSDFPHRQVAVVLSNEPQERWLYGVEREMIVGVKAGNQPVLRQRSGSDDLSPATLDAIEQIDAFEDNIDARTEATLADIERVAGEDASGVTVVGSDPLRFHVQAPARTSVWELSDRLEKHGYEVVETTQAGERNGIEQHHLSIQADEFVTAPDGDEDERIHE